MCWRVRQGWRQRHAPIGVVMRGGGGGCRVRCDVGGVRHCRVARAARGEQVVRGVLGMGGVVAGVHHLPHLLLLLLVDVVGQLSLLVARG